MSGKLHPPPVSEARLCDGHTVQERRLLACASVLESGRESTALWSPGSSPTSGQQALRLRSRVPRALVPLGLFATLEAEEQAVLHP